MKRTVGRRRPGACPEVMRTVAVRLPCGVGAAVVRDGMLQSVEWERSRDELERVLADRYPGAKIVGTDECAAGRLLRAYSEGQPVAPADVAAAGIDWDLARGFRRTVLKALIRVPYGTTVTYGELAGRCGKPGAARAVGAAVARNPWPVLVPCHRVVGAGGRLVGFGKGIDAKRTLLEFEGTRRGGRPGLLKK